MTKKKCTCESCSRSRNIREHLDLINDVVIRKGLSRLINELDMELEIATTDLGRLQAIIDGTWYNATEVMHKAGWIRNAEFDRQNAEDAALSKSKVYIEAYTSQGILAYEGYGVVMEVRANRASYKVRCDDGVEREVFLANSKYPKDRIHTVGEK